MKIVPARYLVSDLKSSVFPGFRTLGSTSSRLLAEVTFRQQGSSVIPWRCHLSFHALDQSDNVSFNSVLSVARTLLDGPPRLMYQQGAMSQVPWRRWLSQPHPPLLKKLGQTWECHFALQVLLTRSIHLQWL